MIKITCSQDGFRRAGIAHPTGTTEYADDTFTKEQLKALEVEPALLVEIVKDKK
jgi:hypothetical protein